MMAALGPHAGFIVTCYAATGLIVALLVAWVVADYRAQTRRLADLEARGLRRRSAARGTVPSDPADGRSAS